MYSISLAQNAFKPWAFHTTFEQRGALFLRLAALLRENADEFAELMHAEMHKPKTQGVAEIQKCALQCTHFATQTSEYLQPEHYTFDTVQATVFYEPSGVVFSIMPWNFPFWQVFRTCVPALMAGNVCIVKHAPNVPKCGFAIEKLFLDAGFPQGVYQNVVLEIPEVEAYIAHSAVRLVTLTGSEQAGASVAALAGKYLKKSILELGGSDAFIVLPDADIKKAAAAAVQSRLSNNGQACIAAKRWLLHNDIAADFLAFVNENIDIWIENTKNKENSTQILTELARFDLKTQIDAQVKDALTHNAHVLIEKTHENAHLTNAFPVFILENINDTMFLHSEEAFATVATVYRFSTTDEAIRIANNSNYGLGGSVWTENTETAAHIARYLEVGFVAINQAVASDPRLPFGGVKNSGFGRELGKEGIREMCVLKTVTQPNH